jgi:CRP-like cAMP-binding protein
MEILRLASLTHMHRLNHEQLALIAPHAAERAVPAGRRLLLDGPFGQELVLIIDGRGVVRCAGESVAELGPGDVFGELAPERPAYATATVTAITDLRLVVFSARAIGLLRDAAPDAVAALLAAGGRAPVAGTGTPTGQRSAPRLSIVRSAAA